MNLRRYCKTQRISLKHISQGLTLFEPENRVKSATPVYSFIFFVHLRTGNSCRSQMADGFVNALGGERYEVKSAGLEAHGLNPRAVQVMKEASVDISCNTSDVIDPEILDRATYVITLCGHADEHCPVIMNPNVIKWHWGALMIRLKQKELK